MIIVIVYVDERLSPTVPGESESVSTPSSSCDYQTFIAQVLAKLQEWFSQVVAVVGLFQACNTSVSFDVDRTPDGGGIGGSHDSVGTEQPGSGVASWEPSSPKGSICDKHEYDPLYVDTVQLWRQQRAEQRSVRRKCEFCDLTSGIWPKFDSDLIRHAELKHNVKLKKGYVGKTDGGSSEPDKHFKECIEYPSQQSLGTSSIPLPVNNGGDVSDAGECCPAVQYKREFSDHFWEGLYEIVGVGKA